jgi:hypothetical protein
MGYMVTLILNGKHLKALVELISTRYSRLFQTDFVHIRNRALWQTGVEGSSLAGQIVGGMFGATVVDVVGWRM